MKNFAWIATWKITHRCNLYCVYCDHASMRKATDNDNIDYEKVIENIRKYSPKIVNISGGEPTLVENLPWIVSEVKKRWNPYIRIVHNGTNPEKIIDCLPFLDKLVISMDGPDPINEQNRGVKGEMVLKKLKEVIPEIVKQNVDIFINCVLTSLNIKYMRDFIQDVHCFSPFITVSFTPIIPPDHQLSILNSKSLFDEFCASYAELKQKGFRVMHVFDGITHHNDLKNIQCYNQYFHIRFTPEGQALSCAMNTKINISQYKYFINRLVAKKGIQKAINRIKKKTKQNFFHSIDFSCNTICACESWLDMIFLNIKSDCISHYARGLCGRITEDEYREVESFVKEHINPKFNALMLQQYIKSSE